MSNLQLTIPRRHLYLLLILMSLHFVVVPWIHLGGEGPEKIFAGYYLAGYNIELSKARFDVRGEIFNSLIFSIIIRLCDLLQLPIKFSVFASLYTMPILCSMVIIFAYLLGSSLFDEKIGLCFSILSGLSYHLWYFSNQTRVTSSCATLMLASAYFFWKTLQKDAKRRWFILWGIFTAFALETEYFAALLLPFYIFYFLVTKRFDLVKKSGLWLGVAACFFALSPWFYLSLISSGSPVGPALTFPGAFMLLRGYGDVLAYLKQIHFYLPFPNFIFLLYGIYISFRYLIHRAQSQANLFALSYFAVIFGGMSLVLGFAADWYSPIVIPSLLLLSSVGLVDVYTQLQRNDRFSAYAQKFYLALTIFSALTINQVHSFFVFYFEHFAIRFYELKIILLGFAIPKIIDWANPQTLDPIIEFLEGVGKPQGLGVYIANILVIIFLASLVVILLRKVKLNVK